MNDRKFKSWRADFREQPVKPSNLRPFEARKATAFQRPPAKYDNMSWEETIDKYEAIDVPLKKKGGKQ